MEKKTFLEVKNLVVEYTSDRKVIRRKWIYNPRSGKSSSEEEELIIPDSVVSEEELRRYISEHRPFWLTASR